MTAPTPIRSWLRAQKDLPARLLERVITWFIADRHSDYGWRNAADGESLHVPRRRGRIHDLRADDRDR